MMFWLSMRAQRTVSRRAPLRRTSESPFATRFAARAVLAATLVMPAEAGIQPGLVLDSRFCGNDEEGWTPLLRE
jgi:hypothetical protein